MTDVLEKCTVCGALLDEEDLFCANCGTAAPHEADSLQRFAVVDGEGASAPRHFGCVGCGASMSFDAKAGALRCPFCGNTNLTQRTEERILRADRIVPFTLQREDAVKTLRRWLGRGIWRPSKLADRAIVTEMVPVYVPYWVFQAKTHSYWTADSSHTPMGARAEWYPVAGEHRGAYSGLLVGASGALTHRETADICPFDLSQAQPHDQLDLTDAVVEQFRVKRKYARPQARQGLESLESHACASQYVPGMCRNMKVNVRIQDLASQPILLPVWVMAYRYRDEIYRFLINGQSGKATGQAPVSWVKVIMLIGFIVLVALLFLLLGALT